MLKTIAIFCVCLSFANTATALNVETPAQITELLNITRPEHRSANLICRATGYPLPEITFRRRGSLDEFPSGEQPEREIYSEQRFGEYSSVSKIGILRIEKVHRSDDGLYECIARNTGGTASAVGHIVVEYPPTIENTKSLPLVYTWNQQTANLSCSAEGFPTPTIVWKWNDRLIKDLDNPNLEIQENGLRTDLLITPREHRYYKTYKCVARNHLGTAERFVELREARIPDIIPQWRTVAVTETSVTFDILSPPYDIGLPITAFVVQYKKHDEPDWANAFSRTWPTDSKFTVDDLQPQTFYDFRFAGVNKVGLSMFRAYIAQSTA